MDLTLNRSLIGSSKCTPFSPTEEIDVHSQWISLNAKSIYQKHGVPLYRVKKIHFCSECCTLNSCDLARKIHSLTEWSMYREVRTDIWKEF